MGPFPHDAPPAGFPKPIPWAPMGWSSSNTPIPQPEKLKALFATMGFAEVARHRSKDVTLWRQGLVNFVVNAEPDSFAQRFAAQHGPCACAMAFRVVDAKHAYERALSLGAEPGEIKVGPMELSIPAIKGIGGSLLYFVDRYGDNGSIWDVDFRWTGERDPKPRASACTTSIISPTTSIAAAWITGPAFTRSCSTSSRSASSISRASSPA